MIMKLIYKGRCWLNLLIIMINRTTKFSAICLLNPPARSVYSAACQVGRSSRVTDGTLFWTSSANAIDFRAFFRQRALTSSCRSAFPPVPLSYPVPRNTMILGTKVVRCKPAADPKTPLKARVWHGSAAGLYPKTSLIFMMAVFLSRNKSCDSGKCESRWTCKSSLAKE